MENTCTNAPYVETYKADVPHDGKVEAELVTSDII